jgi:hypothetical protein
MEDPQNTISVGCMTTAQGPDECMCARYCTEGSARLCASSNSEWLCQDTLRVERFCFDACAANPASPLPAGCEYDTELKAEHCLCTSEGQPCQEPQWDQCLGEESIVSCQRDIWTVFTCEEQCLPTPSLGCMFDRDRNEAVCICHGPGPE